MPELPDVTVYVEAIERRVVGRRLEEILLTSPFVLRTALPPIAAAQGRRVADVRRLGKRIVIELEGELFVVLASDDRRPPALAGSRKPAAGAHHAGDLRIRHRHARVHRGGNAQARVAAPRPGPCRTGGFRPGRRRASDIDAAAFAARLQQENHTLKRALTDPRLFSGIGNAYSDEILHRARLSPLALTHKLSRAGQRAIVCLRPRRSSPNGPSAFGARPARIFPRASPRFGRRWPCMAASASRARTAARRCSASSTRTTKPTTARTARLDGNGAGRSRLVATVEGELAALDRRTRLSQASRARRLGKTGVRRADPRHFRGAATMRWQDYRRSDNVEEA